MTVAAGVVVPAAPSLLFLPLPLGWTDSTTGAAVVYFFKSSKQMGVISHPFPLPAQRCIARPLHSSAAATTVLGVRGALEPLQLGCAGAGLTLEQW